MIYANLKLFLKVKTPGQNMQSKLCTNVKKKDAPTFQAEHPLITFFVASMHCIAKIHKYIGASLFCWIFGFKKNIILFLFFKVTKVMNEHEKT